MAALGNDENVKKDLGLALYMHAEDVMAESQERLVPVRDGGLKSSGYVKPPALGGKSLVEVKLGYSAPYARRTHENPRAGKTGGTSPSGRKYKKWAKVGQWKFLEQPLRDSESRFIAVVAAVVRQAWARRMAG